MIIVFIGAPGSGKGTQSKRISERCGIPHLSTGNILRKAIVDQSEVGMRVKSLMDAGELVSDEIMIDIIRAEIKEDCCKNGFVLDGFPRTLDQAISLSDFLELESLNINFVFYLSLSQSVLAERITGRRISEFGGYEYHIKYKKPKQEGICDITNSKLIQREDDTLENVEKRLRVFNKVTFPLIDFYKKISLLKKIDAEKSINEVSAELFNLLSL